MKLTKKALGAGALALVAAGCGSSATVAPHSVPPKTLTATKTVTVPAAPKTVTVSAMHSTPPKTTAPAPAPTTAPAPAPTTAPAAPPPASAPGLTNAEAVVDQFYEDITDGNYSGAWALGGDNISGGVGYANWVAGYSTTLSITLSSYSQFGSSTVYADLTATQTDGTVKTYSGTYTVSGGVIVAADITQIS